MASTDKEGIKDNLPAEIEKDETDHHESEETNFTTSHNKESVIKYFSCETDQSESDGSKTENVDSQNLIGGFNKNETKTENLSEKEAVDDEKESSKLEEMKETFSKCKVPLDTLISSPVKRKSQQTAEEEIKRKRNTDNAKIEIRNILPDSLNAQDEDLCIDTSEKSKKHLESIVVSIDNTPGGSAERLVRVAINQTDQSASTSKKSETDSADTNKSDFYNIIKSSEHFPSEETLPQQQDMAGIQFPRFKGLEDLENNPEFSQKQILESITHQQHSLIWMKPESERGKITKPLKNKDPKVKSDSSDNLPEEKLGKDETEHSKIEEAKTCQENELMLDTQIRSPVKRKSESCFKVKPKRSTDDLDKGSDHKNLTKDGFKVPTEDCIKILHESVKLERIDNFQLDEGKAIEDLTAEEYYRIRIALKDLENEEPHLFRYSAENEEQAASEEIAYERSVQESLRKNEEIQNPVPNRRSLTEVRSPNRLQSDSSKINERMPQSTLQTFPQLEGLAVRFMENAPSGSQASPPQPSGSQASIVVSIDNTTRCDPSEETLPQQQDMPEIQFPRFKTLEDLENNPELVQNQKQILESITHQQYSLIWMKPESEKGKITKPLKNKDPKVKTDSSDNLPEEKLGKDETEHSKIEEAKTCQENELMLDTQIRSPVKRKSESCFKVKPKRSTDDLDKDSDHKNLTKDGFKVPTVDCIKILHESVKLERIDNFQLDEGKAIEDLTAEEYYRIRIALKDLENEEPHLFRYSAENEEQAASEEIAYERSVQESLRKNEEIQNPVPNRRSLTEVRSPNRLQSDSSKINERMPQSTLQTFPQLEGLAARFMENAPSGSQASPPRPSGSQASPPQPSGSQASIVVSIDNTTRRRCDPSEETLPQQQDMPEIQFPRFKTFEDLENDPELVQNQKQILESITRQQHSLIWMKPDENESQPSGSQASPPQPSGSQASIMVSIDNTPLRRCDPSEETLPQQQDMPGIQFPRLKTFEDLENDPELVQNQKQILESITHQQHSLIWMKPDETVSSPSGSQAGPPQPSGSQAYPPQPKK